MIIFVSLSFLFFFFTIGYANYTCGGANEIVAAATNLHLDSPLPLTTQTNDPAGALIVPAYEGLRYNLST